MNNAKHIAQSLLKSAGITINGDQNHDIQIHNEKTYDRVLSKGSLGLGESYMDGWWDCKNLDQFFYRILDANLDQRIKTNISIITSIAGHGILDIGRKSKAFEVGEKHYDIGNDLFRSMLDKRMTYTCGYWKDAESLDQAQEAKLDLICRKIGLTANQKILDIGSGWGSFMKFAAEKYNATTVGLTISKEQKKYADKLCSGLPIKTRLQDYRDLDEKFDHIVSIGMFEHVGRQNYREYMKVAHKSLNDNGLFLLHTIGMNHSESKGDPWIDKYIFPNGMIPSIKQIGESIEDLFVMEDWHNFGPDYDKTLMEWHKNFESNWDSIKDSYDERFHRMWRYYLLSSAAGFRARKLQLWQIVLSKKRANSTYESVR
jgi:cyclopropane-fatty-acyl-phospholipid synthase